MALDDPAPDADFRGYGGPRAVHSAGQNQPTPAGVSDLVRQRLEKSRKQDFLPMSNANALPGFLQALTAPTLLLMMFFGADSLVGKEASKTLSDAIDATARNPNESKPAKALEEFLEDNFSFKKGPANFFQSVFLLTIFSLLFFLTIYTARTTSLYDQLLTKGFLTQFIGNGLLITFAINCFLFAQYNNLLASFVASSILRNLLWIFSDICVKAFLFIGLTTLIYISFALTTNAFGGDVRDAISAVPITIWKALFFENLTSVYIYSMLLSSVPIYLVVLIKLMILHPGFTKSIQRMIFFLPVKEKPIRAAAVLFSAILASFGLVLTALLAPFK